MNTSTDIQRSQQTTFYPPRPENSPLPFAGGGNPPASGLSSSSYSQGGLLNRSQPHVEGRRNSGNFPDIVDSDICFLSTSSEIDLSQRMESANTTNQAGRGTNVSPPVVTVTSPTSTTPPRTSSSSSSGIVSEHRRSISAIIDHQQFLDQSSSGVSTEGPTDSDTTPTSPTHLPVPTQGTSGGVTGLTQISTQDLNVGVVSRLNPHHEALPDLLHSHVIPSHVLPGGGRHAHPQRPSNMEHQVYANNYHGHPRHHPRHHHRDGHRSGTRRTHRSGSRSGSQSSNEPCKENCMSGLAAATSFRWILVVLSLLGVCCVVTGIVLAALHAAGNSFLFLAIMFIGKSIAIYTVQ